MDPQQELFTALKLGIENLGYDVYDGTLPPDGTPYPFVYLGESSLVDRQTKSAVIGTVRQTIHVWHNSPKKRGTVSEMMLNIKRVARDIERTKHFGWFVRSLNQQTLPDNTTGQPLLHGVLDIQYQFS